VSSPYAAYAFHWFEAVLMGTVTPLAMLVHGFELHSLALFPLAALVLNVLCHWNHDLLPDAPSTNWLAVTRRHGLHHTHVHGNYGFTLPLFDRLFGTTLPDARPAARVSTE